MAASWSLIYELMCRRLFEEWTVELKGMADRIISMRHQLYDALQARGVLPFLIYSHYVLLRFFVSLLRILHTKTSLKLQPRCRKCTWLSMEFCNIVIISGVASKGGLEPFT